MTDTVRPSGGASSELRRTIWPWSTDIPLLSADPFNLDARLVIGGQEFVRCTGRSGYTLTGCERGISPEDGGSGAKYWPGGTSVDQIAWTTTEVVTVYPTTPTLAMVGRDFAWDAGDGNIYRYHVVLIEGTPVVIWDDEPPGTGMAFTWASAITGLTNLVAVALDASGNIYTGQGAADILRKYSAALALLWTQSSILITNHVATDGTTVFGVDGFTPTIYKRLASTGAAGSPATFGTAGSGNGQLGPLPVGICFDGTNVWVVDRGNNRIQKFTASTGAYVSQFDGSTSGLAFNKPTDIAIGPTSTHLYILDPLNGRVVKFLKSDHSWVATFTLGNGTADGQISTTAEGIAVDSLGRIWIADTGNHRIQVYSSAGVFLGKIGSFGSGDSQFKSPKQIAVSSTDVIYVADSGNNRLVTVQEDPGGITPVIVERAGASTALGSPGSATATATCTAGEVSIGGGLTTAGAQVAVTESHRSGTTGWTTTARNSGGAGISFTPTVLCMISPLPGGTVGPAGPAGAAGANALISSLTDTASVDLTNTAGALSAVVLPAGVDHNSLANLATGDPHTQYALDTDLTTHAALTIAHGATGAVVGTTNAQTLTNKTLTAPTFSAGTTAAGTAPNKYTAGTLLTVAEAGAQEFDGSGFFFTADTTNGRADDNIQQVFRLGADASAIGATIADFFGANSAIPTIASGVYEIVWYCWYTKTTAGTVTYTIVSSTAPTRAKASYQQTPAAGIGTNGALTGAGVKSTTATSIVLPATASLTTAVDHYAEVRALIVTNTAGNVRLRVTESAGTVTPLADSYFTVRRVPANTGAFLA